VIWYESAPGAPEGVNPALRNFQEYGANWVLGFKATF
jgi:hypothetical protein